MGFGAKGGITKLSELVIDADKELAYKVLSKLGGLDKNPVRGDIWIFSQSDHAELTVKRLPAAELNKVIASGGIGKDPYWDYVWNLGAASSLDRVFPAFVELTYNEATHTLAESESIDAPITSSYDVDVA